MEFNRLDSEWGVLVAHMRATGYSDAYVGQMERSVARLLDAAPTLGGWEDVPRWVSKWPDKGTRGPMGCLLTIARHFDEEGVLPRTPESVSHRRTRSRDALCAGLGAVLDAYESSDAAARKSPSSVKAELSNAASFLSRLEALGRTSLDEVTEDDVLSVLTGPDGLPAYSKSHAQHVRAVFGGAAEAGLEGAAELRALVPVPRRWRRLQHALTKDEVDAIKRVLGD